MGDQQPKVNKVQPYPFVVHVDKEGKKERVEALKLVHHGLLVDIKNLVVKVGENLKIELFLPAGHGEIVTEAKVIKTYDQFRGSPDGPTRRIAELHFNRLPLPEIDRLKVKSFLKQISQSGTLKK